MKETNRCSRQLTCLKGFYCGTSKNLLCKEHLSGLWKWFLVHFMLKKSQEILITSQSEKHWKNTRLCSVRWEVWEVGMKIVHVQTTLTDITINLLQLESRPNLMCGWSRLKSSNRTFKNTLCWRDPLGVWEQFEENSCPMPQPGEKGNCWRLSLILATSTFLLPASRLSFTGWSEWAVRFQSSFQVKAYISSLLHKA